MSEKPPPRPTRPPSPASPPTTPPLPHRAPTSAVPTSAPPPRTFSSNSAPPTPIPAIVRPRAPAPAVSDDDLATRLFEAATAEQAELVVIAGAHKGKTVSLGAGTVVIGRGTDCELSLKGSVGASRRHCKVQYLGNRFVVIDLESRNGTVVNGQSVERKVLEPNDKIELGDEVIQFIVHRLADLGAIDDSISSPFDETNSKKLRAPPTNPNNRVGNVLLDAVDLGSPVSLHADALLNQVVSPPAKTPSSSTIPAAVPAVIAASTTPPMPAPPAAAQGPTSSRSTWIFAGAVMTITGAATLLIYDIVSTPSIDPKTIAALAVVDAGTMVAASAPTPLATAAAAADAAVTDAGVSAVVVADAGAVAPVAAAAVVAAAGTPITLQATGAGRALAVKVKVGDRVSAGDVVVVVSSEPGTLARKLEALRREEREFADAARRDPSLNADLEQVRRDIKRIQARLEARPQTATQAGVVVEVLVKEGDAVAAGTPLVRLQ